VVVEGGPYSNIADSDGDGDTWRDDPGVVADDRPLETNVVTGDSTVRSRIDSVEEYSCITLMTPAC